jgi:hypothetical protein
VTAEFEVLIAVIMTSTLFRMPCSSGEVHRCFGGSTFLENISGLIPDYVVLHPIKQFYFVQRVYFSSMNSGGRVLSRWTNPEPLKFTSQQHYIRTLTVFPFGILVWEQYCVQRENMEK